MMERQNMDKSLGREKNPMLGLHFSTWGRRDCWMEGRRSHLQGGGGERDVPRLHVSLPRSRRNLQCQKKGRLRQQLALPLGTTTTLGGGSTRWEIEHQDSIQGQHLSRTQKLHNQSGRVRLTKVGEKEVLSRWREGGGTHATTARASP
jgi:hypothetical protein